MRVRGDLGAACPRRRGTLPGFGSRPGPGRAKTHRASTCLRRPELNGQRGRALKWNAETRRIGVDLGEGVGKLSVRAENVRLPTAADPPSQQQLAAAAAAAVEQPKALVNLGEEFRELRAALAEAADQPASITMLQTSLQASARARARARVRLG